jgi:transcriptional regulator with GAF, ATPase, and Fis domain/predicted Ser/Thr protein kinase
VKPLPFPSRYEALSPLGKGGGGEVWAVRDRHTGERRALKILAAEATETEMAALVREAVTLSGLEGLGVPRVLRFGRLPEIGRPFMVRELVDGKSLDEFIVESKSATPCLEALASASDQITLLHRAGLLHGDIKPANVIVDDEGRATLVDLGLSAPWREQGTAARGLTPRYAAPELFAGRPITVRAEIYALGVALSDVVTQFRGRFDAAAETELDAVVQRATSRDPDERHPSADEFANALRRAAGIAAQPVHVASGGEVWPIVGIEATASRLLSSATELPPGGALVVRGDAGSGRSVLLRRLGWSLGVDGHKLSWIDESLAGNVQAIGVELDEHEPSGEVTILVDDCDELPQDLQQRLVEARRRGARLVLVGDAAFVDKAESFAVPPLGTHAASELLRRAVPSLTERLIKRVVAACKAQPGRLRTFVRLVAEQAVASESDVLELLQGMEPAPPSTPGDPLTTATSLLDRGRYNDAKTALDRAEDADAFDVGVQRVRLELGLGESRAALDRATALEGEATRRGPETARAVRLLSGRAHMGLGDYLSALQLLEPLATDRDAVGCEALAHLGLALSYTGRFDLAKRALLDSIERARELAIRRTEALAQLCLGSVLQREDDTLGARTAYEKAIFAAESAGDAGLLATAQLNLAGILKMSGEIAGAIEHFEAAVDMGRRSGRRGTARQALLNLANTDLYVGRIARARSSIDALAEQRDQLTRAGQAQLLGLEAELASRSKEPERARAAFEACADAYVELDFLEAAAEARLEGVLVSARDEQPDLEGLTRSIAQAEGELGTSTAHRSLLALARASVCWAQDDEASARAELERALASAREAKQKDWIFRTLEIKSEIEEVSGQPVSARRDREEALAVLEEIAARLPRDLREVFWSDPRRRTLRKAGQSLNSVSLLQGDESVLDLHEAGTASTASITSMTSTPLERRLARILEINAELLGEVNLERLAARVTDHAVDMLRAERGFVLLRDDDGVLTVHTSRARSGDAATLEFSRSIAEQVIRTGEPVVAVNAKGDARLRGFASVHQLSLESVACVPIQSRRGEPIGALYVETRLRPGASFERELPTLRAFADQVAIALETAALIRENEGRARELAESNEQLEKAQNELKELLGDRTEQLRRARRKLRAAHDTLYGHFGYQGLVGTSAAMRRVYALIDRVRDADVPVLITGESGTGKEVAARAIHRASSRSGQPFFGLNCGAVPEHLLESELFGHVRGAFTGADRERKGLFREASGGTLLLDEIGEMPQKMQTGLLRVLQERMVRPVGGAQELPVDVRLVFATHRDLETLVKEGKFREDLFYRIHVVEVRIPPLRERAEDIAPLVDHFLGIFAARYKRDKRSVSRDALRRLSAYAWPGNVRQLEHVLLNAWVLSDEAILDAEDFDIPDGRSLDSHDDDDDDEVEDSEGDETAIAAMAPVAARSSDSQTERRPPKDALSRHRRDERERILQALQACNWNRVQAAKVSGIPRRTFYRRLREYGIQ